MNCRCGFLMSVRAGGGYECRRCGQTEQVPVKAPVNWAAAGATDQTLPPPPPAPVVLEPAPAPEPIRHVPRPPIPSRRSKTRPIRLFHVTHSLFRGGRSAAGGRSRE
jgi:hypothetical protein